MSNVTTESEASPVPKAVLQKAIIASVIGNGLEWYDYMLYGFFSIFIARAFFPDENVFMQTLLSLLTFSFAFFFRPLGGVLIGIYADRYGRKPALIFMIILMGTATVLIGLTPSYGAIGILATFIIVFARILQGISVGGEFGGATALLVEYAPKKSHYLFASFQSFTQALATFLASGFGLIMISILSDDQASSWGWRVLFLLGGIIAPLGLYIRRQVPETPEFLKIKQQHRTQKSPLASVLKRHKKKIIAGLGLVAIGGSANYVWFIYMTVYVVHTLELPLQSIFLSNTIAAVILMIGIYLAGLAADKYGGVRVFVLGVVLFGASSVPLFLFVLNDPSFVNLIITQSIGCLFMPLIWAPTPGIFAHLFPSEIRATGISVSYNLGVIVFGAMAPPLLTVLIEYTGIKLIPSFYLLFCAALSLIFLYFSRSEFEELGKNQVNQELLEVPG